MQSAAKIVVSIFVLTSVLATAYHSNAKLRRDGVLNLYPFPRVGRASHRTWQVPLNDLYLEDYEPGEKRQMYAFPRVGRGEASMLRGPLRVDQINDYEPVDKRQLYAFPRVGRGDASMLRGPMHADQMQAMPIRRTDSPGMWFGPRLGRSVKTDEDEITIQNENEKSEPEQLEPDHLERKKRGTTPL